MELEKLPKKIEICEVGPRDGLQNEKSLLSVEQKAELINRCVEAGAKCVEVGSFVSAKAIPAMADTDEVCARIKRVPGVDYRGLIFNMKGLQRAEAAGLTSCEVAVSASRGHCLANMHKTPEQAVESFKEVVEYANAHGIKLMAAISTTFGCSIDGRVPFEQVVSVAKCLRALGLTTINLADTTGMANPAQVYRYATDIQKILPDVTVFLHFHNTRGLGLANVLAGLEAGITHYEASFGGLGGCPFAPGASGNIATEDLINMCDEMGIATGLNLDRYLELGRRAEEFVGGSRGSSLLRAGKCADIVAGKK